MQIEFENKFSDIVLYYCVHQFLSVVTQSFFIIISVFFFLLETNTLSNFSAAITAIIIYIAMWMVQFVFNAIYLFSRKNGSMLGKRKIELLNEGLLEESNFNKSLYYWHGIVKAVSRPGFIGIYTSPVQAHVIPNKYFKSKAERENFLAMVTKKISTGAASNKQ